MNVRFGLSGWMELGSTSLRAPNKGNVIATHVRRGTLSTGSEFLL
jgi:hypothetical protein